MTTILNKVEINGIGLMDGKESKVILEPSEEKGIYFYPENAENHVKASLESVISTSNCTVLGNASQQIRVVEHFMAACAFAGIDSLNVYMSSSELPILDGSAIKWEELFKKAGIKEDKTSIIQFKEPIYYTNKHTNLVLFPADEFQVSYCVNFDHSELENRWFNWKVYDNRIEILQARTFGYLKDLEKFQKAGLALGASVDNIIGLTEEGYTTELRTKFEPVKHKILDIIGDLYLTGYNPLSFKAHIFAKDAGHKTHVAFAKVIQGSLEKK